MTIDRGILALLEAKPGKENTSVVIHLGLKICTRNNIQTGWLEPHAYDK